MINDISVGDLLERKNSGGEVVIVVKEPEPGGTYIFCKYIDGYDATTLSIISIDYLIPVSIEHCVELGYSRDRIMEITLELMEYQMSKTSIKLPGNTTKH